MWPELQLLMVFMPENIGYTPSDWYWRVGGQSPLTQVYSSFEVGYVPNNNLRFLSWFAEGNRATFIASQVELAQVLNEAELPHLRPPGEPAPRAVTLKQRIAVLDLLAAPQDPFTFVRLAADSTHNTTTLTPVSGILLPVLANSSYIVELIGAMRSAATTTGIGLALDIPSGTIIGGGQNNSSTTASSSFFQRADATVIAATTGVQAINLDIPIRGKWLIETGTTAGNINLMCRSEIASSAVTLKAGLRMFIRQIPLL